MKTASWRLRKEMEDDRELGKRIELNYYYLKETECALFDYFSNAFSVKFFLKKNFLRFTVERRMIVEEEMKKMIEGEDNGLKKTFNSSV